ncbi:MAG: M23 family metallopeptidase [Myxococcales bacterium]|nr:M23 family metallopeptidase [Myxococcales bacterium]
MGNRGPRLGNAHGRARVLGAALAPPVWTLLLWVGLRAAPAAPLPLASVPFACGRSFVVSQAHQVGSHRSHDEFAWDFRMPEGEPIVAAMPGVVRLARGDSIIGGCDAAFAREANFVVISHDGGIETQYLHFSKVVVKPAEAVQQGQLIGYSGRTGWACGSHLHFKVARAESPSWNNRSIPARIEGHGDPGFGVRVDAPPCGGASARPELASP